VRDLSCGDARVYVEFAVRRVQCRSCGKVKQEKLAWLADNPFYTKRFAFYVGQRCRSSTIRDVARELKLDWKTVKELEKQYMREQLRRAPKPAPRIIGIDEIAIRKGHTYRIVVSDLERGRPIWFGGTDRSEASMDQFFAELGPKTNARIELALMDMWKAFRNSTERHAPQASILFDKFHVMRHLGDALDTVRKSEYGRLQGKDRQYIKGQKYTLLSHRENLTLDGRRALKKLLAANKRLNTAYLLKESFGQLWDYRSEAWARRFFENWKAALKWQRLKPYEKFARMIERHWDGIAAYCRVENKVSLGFVEGFNNKIRVIQRRAYGLRDEEYFRLKVLTCMLAPI
jgi:transposase